MIPPNASSHHNHVASPLFRRRSKIRRGNVALGSVASKRTNPFSMLPLPYSTTICVSPEGRGTVSVCAFEPEATPCSVIVIVLVPGVSLSRPGCAGTLTKAFSSEAYHRLIPVSYTHLRAHETRHDLVCRLLLEKKKKK